MSNIHYIRINGSSSCCWDEPTQHKFVFNNYELFAIYLFDSAILIATDATIFSNNKYDTGELIETNNPNYNPLDNSDAQSEKDLVKIEKFNP